jgi:hypothetical protein
MWFRMACAGEGEWRSLFVRGGTCETCKVVGDSTRRRLYSRSVDAGEIVLINYLIRNQYFVIMEQDYAQNRIILLRFEVLWSGMLCHNILPPSSRSNCKLRKQQNFLAVWFYHKCIYILIIIFVVVLLYFNVPYHFHQQPACFPHIILLLLILLLLLLLLLLYSSLVGLGHFFSFLILYTVGRTPWTRDQPFARPLPTHRTTQTQNKRTQCRHPCLQWDLNPRFQHSSERRQFIP